MAEITLTRRWWQQPTAPVPYPGNHRSGTTAVPEEDTTAYVPGYNLEIFFKSSPWTPVTQQMIIFSTTSTHSSTWEAPARFPTQTSARCPRDGHHRHCLGDFIRWVTKEPPYEQFSQLLRAIQGEKVRQARRSRPLIPRVLGPSFIEVADFQRIVQETTGHKVVRRSTIS
ncbi:hypothetical protein FPQ18DRAFT_311085 [Pyronema domesticum]|nr:hypothetical protein FPQ18DRAFT_311085 [Pyronema domesticum]